MTKTIIRFIFAIIVLCCSMPATGFPDDLNDGIEPDGPIAKEDSISQKKGNTSFDIRKATSDVNKEAKEQKKEADKYTTYEFKGPLGNTHEIELKEDKDHKNVPAPQANGMNVNSVIVGPGAKTQDITVINKSDKPITQIINK